MEAAHTRRPFLRGPNHNDNIHTTGTSTLIRRAVTIPTVDFDIYLPTSKAMSSSSYPALRLLLFTDARTGNWIRHAYAAIPYSSIWDHGLFKIRRRMEHLTTLMVLFRKYGQRDRLILMGARFPKKSLDAPRGEHCRLLCLEVTLRDHGTQCRHYRLRVRN
jgi:hypothetical protein